MDNVAKGRCWEGLADVTIHKNYQTMPTRWEDVDWDGTPDKKWRPGFAARLQESVVWKRQF